jgi:hypothetical protein
MIVDVVGGSTTTKYLLIISPVWLTTIIMKLVDLC